MKNEYLWEKKGSDPDIERLEDLLSGFRYKEPGQSASNVLEFPSKAKRSLQPWIFAMAACAAIAAVALTAWNLSSTGMDPVPQQTAKITEAPKGSESPAATETFVTEKPDVIIPTPELTTTVRKRRPTPKQRHLAVSQKRKDSRATPTLTNEEKYAYGQLMLALSITSSKWQVVQDSINGNDKGRTNER